MWCKQEFHQYATNGHAIVRRNLPSIARGTLSALHARHSQRLHKRRVHSQVRAVAQTQLQYQKLGDSDLLISEVTLGTVCIKLETTVPLL